MKKTITLLLLFLIFSLGYSQTSNTLTAYKLNSSSKSYRFDGSQANFTNGVTLLNIDTVALFAAPIGYAVFLFNQAYMAPAFCVWDNQDFKVYDSLGFYNNYSYNANDRDIVWKADKPSYYTITQVNANFKSITYSPTLTLNGSVLSAGGNSVTLPSAVTPTITTSNDIVITGTWPNINISQYVPTTYTVTRSLMTGSTSVTYTISTRQAEVDYSINVDQSATLSSTQSMTVFAEYSTNGGSTWIGQDASKNSLTYGLSVTIGNVVGGTLKITGTVPGSALVRIRTSGTGTASYLFGKEKY